MTYQLTIQPLGQTLEVAAGQTILDACLRSGIWLPHACCHGLCATCKIQLTDGEVDHGEASPFALMDFERDEGKTLACCATLESDIVIEADIDEEPDAEIIPVQDFSGVVSRIETLTPTIKGIFITLDEAMHFQAGQYVNLDIPGLGISRPFSLANPLSTGCEIELNVRRVPGGEGTAFLHDELAEGASVRLSGPYGRFFVRKSAPEPVLFLAGGSGLSSPRSMILDLLESGDGRPITLVYGQRTRDELYYHDAFAALAKDWPEFSYIPALSEDAEGTEWGGFKGFVHDAANDHFSGDFRDHKAYICGPPAMVEACIRTLMQGRLFERDIYTEKFLSAADAQTARSPLFRRL